jgi:hypothetical protein
MTERVKPFFECPHCCKKLTTEARLAKHNCEEKKRYDYLQTMKGKSAFYCYKAWMNFQGRQVKDQDTFMNSKYFNSFVEFVKFCNRVGVPDRKHYVEFMVDKGLMPTHWVMPDVYEEYIRHFDVSKTPKQMAEITMSTIFDLSEIFECEPGEVFEHMTSADIMRLVTARKLSPWLLLFSQGFMNHIRTDTTPEQRILINTVISHKMWRNRFNEDPESVALMRSIVEEFKI